MSTPERFAIGLVLLAFVLTCGSLMFRDERNQREFRMSVIAQRRSVTVQHVHSHRVIGRAEPAHTGDNVAAVTE